MRQSKLKVGMIYFGLSFWAAFLLFLIQPLIGKLLLPWFGGVAAVWIVSMVFFTVVLLLGYLYAHFLILKLKPKWQVGLHFLVIILTGWLAVYELRGLEESLPTLGRQVLDNFDFPAITLLLILLKTIGFPYFVLATTSPIIQAWYGRAGFGVPYKLYSISNAGSLVAIIAYPFMIEPLWTVTFQTQVWLGGFLVFIILLIIAGINFLIKASRAGVVISEKKVPSTVVPIKTKLVWLGLALLPAMMLLTVTTKITKGIAAVPFLWLLPLAIYLISFIICFSQKKKIDPKIFAFLFIALIFWAGIINLIEIHFSLLILAEVLIFGAVAMFCHAQLFERRPQIDNLTLYYLYISIGGALGSMLIGLVAPVIFSGYSEYYLVLISALILAGYILRVETKKVYQLLKPKMRWTLAITLLILLFFLVFFLIQNNYKKKVMVRSRNFFGTLEVIKRMNSYGESLVLRNGSILHGTQLTASADLSRPTSYYSEDSGVGLLMRSRQQVNLKPERVGVVGLGAGTMAAYCRPGDTYVFYDINPQIVKIAEQNFSYLKQCSDRGGEIITKIGDARLVLEQELQENNYQPYDVLVLDAFSDDAIPIHLLTAEAMQIYLKLLHPQGVLAVHISNRYFDLKPVLRQLADKYQLGETVITNFDSDTNLEKIPSMWVLLAKDKDILQNESLRATGSLQTEKNIRLWTDQFSNLLPIIK